MIGFIRRLFKDRRGNALAIACACMPLFIGAAGLATDTIEWTLWKRQLQRAADSAAFAGVYDRVAATNGATTNTPTAVCRDLAVNLHTWMSLLATSPCTGSVGSYTTLSYPSDTAFVSRKVLVTLRIQQRLPFSSLFMSAAPVITATATAGAVTGGPPCMLALSTSGTAIDNNGNTTVTAPTCIFYSDSASSNSAAAGGSSLVTARAIAGVGGIASSNNWVVNQYMPYSPPLPDPFAPPSSTAVTPDASDMRCAKAPVTTTTTVVDQPEVGHWVTHGNHQDWVVDTPAVTHQQTTTTYSGAAQALTAGADITTMKDANGNQANCFTSLSVGSSGSLTIPNSYTGPIYINGGNVNFQGDFTCGACTIVLTNTDTSNTATIGTYDSNAQAKVNITAPTTGVYRGIAVYQDRRAPGGNVDKINGGVNNVVNGVVYFPKDTLWLNGTGNTVSLCSMFVASNLVFKGNSSIAISSANDTACSGILPQTGGTTVVRLIS
jgi:Flp pilus assembly protein TadG